MSKQHSHRYFLTSTLAFGLFLLTLPGHATGTVAEIMTKASEKLAANKAKGETTGETANDATKGPRIVALGLINSISGDVRVIRSGKTYAAKIGSPLSQQDVVTTGKNSSAKIIMADKSIVVLQPESELKLSNFQTRSPNTKAKTEFELPQGSVRFKVEPLLAEESFEVRTPIAVVGVRGTEFIVSHAKGISEVVTFAGLVDFGQRGLQAQTLNPLKVPANSVGTYKKDEAAAQVKTLQTAELEKLNKRTTFEFLQKQKVKPASEKESGGSGSDATVGNSGAPPAAAGASGQKTTPTGR